jgi:NADH-quinone oxidoreductase subunit E
VTQERPSAVRDALGGSVSGRGKQPSRELEVLTGPLERAAKEIIAKYPNSRSAALPLLFLAQAKDGYLTEAGMRDVGQLLGLTPAEVLATASFYTMLKKEPQGRYLISVCRNISCTHRGSRKIVAALTERLGIEPGQTTADGTFTLETAECLATCDGAPAIQVNYEDFYDVTPETAVDIVTGLERGHEVKGTRGAAIKTQREIAWETAVAGAWRPARRAAAAGEAPIGETDQGVPPAAPSSEPDASAARGSTPETEARSEPAADGPATAEAPESPPDQPTARTGEADPEVVTSEGALPQQSPMRPEEQREPGLDSEEQRTIGGHTVPRDLAPGWRPRVEGSTEEDLDA